MIFQGYLSGLKKFQYNKIYITQIQNMENYTVIQKLLLLNSISVIIAILITIAHENQRTDTLFATLTIQITYVAISTLNWVIQRKYIFRENDEVLILKYQQISMFTFIICVLLSTTELYFRQSYQDFTEFLSSLILISTQQELLLQKAPTRIKQQLNQIGEKLILSLNVFALIGYSIFEIMIIDHQSSSRAFKLRSCIISSILVVASLQSLNKFQNEDENQLRGSVLLDEKKKQVVKSNFLRHLHSQNFSSQILDININKEEEPEIQYQYHYSFSLSDYFSMNSSACLLVDKNYIILEQNPYFKEFFRSNHQLIEKENLVEFFSKFTVSRSKIEIIQEGKVQRSSSLNQKKKKNNFNLIDSRQDNILKISDDQQCSSHLNNQLNNQNINYSLYSVLRKMIQNNQNQTIRKRRTSVIEEVEYSNNSFKKIKGQLNEKTYNIQIFRKGLGFYDEFLIVFEDISYKQRQENKASNHSFKSKILHSVSHQLRTPLNYSIGVLQNFIQKLVSKIQYQSKNEENIDQYELTNVLYRNKHLLSIVNDIIDLGEQDFGKLSFHFDLFNLHELVQEVLKYFQLSIEKKNLETKVIIDPNVQEIIKNDAKRLLQVLLNIFDNAIKFTQQGQITLKMTKSPQLDSKQELIQISIIDTGCGMAPEQLSYFVKLMNNLNIEEGVEDENHQINSKGFGLGFAVSKYLIRGLNSGCGKIEIVSIEKVGTSFTFQIKDFHETGCIGYKMRKKAILELGDVYEFIPNKKQPLFTNSNYCSTPIELKKQFESMIIDHIMEAKDTKVSYIYQEEENVYSEESKILINSPYSTATQLMKKSIFNDIINPSKSVSPPTQTNNDFSNSRQPYYQISQINESQLIPRSKILVVDDNQFNVQCMQIMLESEGFFSDCCFTGERALEIITEKLFEQQQIYSLIFMDIDMPGWDGFETAQNIHRFLNGQQISDSAYTICCCTAFTDDDSRTSAKASGMSLFISQPIDNNGIRKVIESVGLKKKGGIILQY